MINNDTISSMMTDTETFRQKVIDAGIQGKLTEQLPEDGNAEDLYQQIQEEKVKLIKEGKIKKSKPLQEIKTEDIPFEIPKSWKWVRLNTIFDVINGDRGKNYPAKSTLTHTGIPFISALNLNGKTVVKDERLLCLSDEQYQKLGNGKLKKGDVVVCIRGSLGKHGRYPFEKGAIASSLVICREYCSMDVLCSLLMFYLDSELFFSQIIQYNNGTAQPNLAAADLKKFLFPLPPINEQERIVDRINEILDTQKHLAQSLKEYSSNVEVLKSKVIDAGIQGKLTEQLPEDGNAEDLYQQIQTEKAKFVKEGKIKKSKPLPPIKPEEIPFEIPKNWKWVRLNDISYNIWAGRDKPSDFQKTKDNNHKIPVVGNGTKDDGILGYTASATAAANTITIAGRGTIGFAVLRQYEYCPIVRLIVIEQSKYMNPDYLKYYVSLNPESSTGSSIPQLTVPMIKPKLIPLPPLAEQERIAGRINDILRATEQ